MSTRLVREQDLTLSKLLNHYSFSNSQSQLIFVFERSLAW